MAVSIADCEQCFALNCNSEASSLSRMCRGRQATGHRPIPNGAGRLRPRRFRPYELNGEASGWRCHANLLVSLSILAAENLWLGRDGNLNVRTLFELHIIAIFIR